MDREPGFVPNTPDDSRLEPVETEIQTHPFGWWQSTYLNMSQGLDATWREIQKIHHEQSDLKAKTELTATESARLAELNRKLNDLEPIVVGESSRTRAAAREAAAVFVEPLPDKPWLEPRKIPALPHVTISQREIIQGGVTEADVPGWDANFFYHPSRYFNTIDKFYLPSRWYLEHFQQLRNRDALYPEDPVDRRVFSLATDALMPLENRHNPIWIEHVWHNWVLATKIVGLDPLVDQQRVSTKVMLHLPKRDSPDEPPRFFTKEELLSRRDDLMRDVVTGHGPRRDSDAAKQM